jgi:hypothetical protein
MTAHDFLANTRVVDFQGSPPSSTDLRRGTRERLQLSQTRCLRTANYLGIADAFVQRLAQELVVVTKLEQQSCEDRKREHGDAFESLEWVITGLGGFIRVDHVVESASCELDVDPDPPDRIDGVNHRLESVPHPHK